MGRKRNQGKARKAAAKAKAREEEEERGRTMTDGGQRHERAMLEQQLLQAISKDEQQVEFQMSLPSDLECKHGSPLPPPSNDINFQFALQFAEKYTEACDRGDRSVDVCLIEAKNATMDEFADVWNDIDKMEAAMSVFLGTGTYILGGNHLGARGYATLARFFEQIIAVDLKRSQALINWPKIFVTSHADEHSLVKFFRHRIPCSCLDKRYEEVKSITKVGFCYNLQCKLPGGTAERSKIKYCSRCRCVTYCSRDCQEANWPVHKPICDRNSAIITRFH